MRRAISSGGGFATELLHELTRGADRLVDGLDHMHRNADGARLIGDGAGDGLTDPPGRVGGELVAAAVLELVDGLHEADVALLDEVEELQAAVGVLLGDGDDEAKVGLNELALGAGGVHVSLDHLALGALEIDESDAGVLLEFFEVEAAVLLLALVLLAQLLGLGVLVLGVKLLDLALEGAHDVDGLVDLVEQALLFGVGVLQLADDAGEVDGLAADEPAVLAEVLGLGLGIAALRRLAAGLERGGLLLVLDDGVDARDGGADAGGEDLFGELFLIEGHDFLDAADAAAQIFAETDDLANDDGRARDGLHDAELAAFDALGDLNFTFAGEQRDGAHLAEVHADGVVGLLELAGGEVELDVFGLFTGFGRELVVASAELGVGVEDVDALGVDGGEEIVEVVGRGDVAGEKVVDLAVGEVALLFASVDDAVYVFFVLFFFGCHVFAPDPVRWYAENSEALGKGENF